MVGMSKPQVYAAMASAGLYFRTIGPADWNVAVGESPPYGTVVAWHATVTVRTAHSAAVPSPPVSGATTMPDVLYRTRAETYRAMAAAGLYFRTVGPANWDIVTAQNPRPGTRIAVRSEVTVGTAYVRTSSPSPVRRSRATGRSPRGADSGR